MTSPAWVKRRPFLMPIGVLLAAIALAACALALATWWLVTASSLQVIVVPAGVASTGPAERAARDPASRGEILARLWGDVRFSGHIDAIYVDGTSAAHDLAAPSAARLALTLITVAEEGSALARRVLDEHPGGRVLAVVSAERLAALMAGLSGESPLPAGNDEFFVVAIPRFGRATYLRLRY
jgi:hypothetical protein